MQFQNRLKYYRRIFPAYLTRQKSHLTFWHGTPQVNEESRAGELGEYYMPFLAKADYLGQYDAQGIPMLDYHGDVGLQYNPIAIAQYGLGNYNLYRRSFDQRRRQKFLAAARWLVDNLERNDNGQWVWNHHFDWEYRSQLRAPWYSALSQGQGISLLVRADQVTRDREFSEVADRAFESFLKQLDEGGVSHRDEDGHTWFEETVVDPPTHILNGFIWASWGVYDYYLHTGSDDAKHLFDEAVQTLADNLHCYDVGFWSLYEQSGTRMKMLASHFYHSLHIVQLQVMYRLTGMPVFSEYAQRWESYRHDPIKPRLALAHKALFKLLYY